MHLMDLRQHAEHARDIWHDGRVMRVSKNLRRKPSTKTSSLTQEITVESESALSAATTACRQKTSKNIVAANVAIEGT